MALNVMAALFPASFGAASVGSPVTPSATVGPTDKQPVEDPSDPRPALQYAAEVVDIPPTPAAIATAAALEGQTAPTVKTANAVSTDTSNAVVIAATVNDPTSQERIYRRWLAAAISNIFDNQQSPGHPQRLALAGAILQNGLARTLLVELVLTNVTNYTNVLNFPGTPGGTLVDTDIDYAIAKLFPGLAIARNW